MHFQAYMHLYCAHLPPQTHNYPNLSVHSCSYTPLIYSSTIYCYTHLHRFTYKCNSFCFSIRHNSTSLIIVHKCEVALNGSGKCGYVTICSSQVNRFRRSTVRIFATTTSICTLGHLHHSLASVVSIIIDGLNLLSNLERVKWTTHLLIGNSHILHPFWCNKCTVPSGPF